MVFTRVRTRNQAELDAYRKSVSASLAGHKLKALANYSPYEVLEGPQVEGVVILEFPTRAEAKAWYSSPAYQEAVQHRFLGADYGVIIVEGEN
ncbi:MAG: DUF1330 domain-containing protein [Nitrososphaerales archaeon]